MPALHAPVRSEAERNALVVQWIYLPRHVLRRLWHIRAVRRLGSDEALQAAYLGLLRAASLWREDGGAAFQSYAYAAIRRAIWRAALEVEKVEGWMMQLIEGWSVAAEGKAAGQVDAADEVAELLRGLSRADRRLLTSRYGLRDGKERTLEQLARPRGMCKEAVRLRIEKALRRGRELITGER